MPATYFGLNGGLLGPLYLEVIVCENVCIMYG